MIRSFFHCVLIVAAISAAAIPGFGQEESEEEKAWPRVMEAEKVTVAMYEPQIDTWRDDDFEARAAVSVKEGDAAPVFGAVWITGRIDVDRDARMVDFFDIKIPTVAFPEASEEHQQQLMAFLEREIPKWDLEVELDRVIPLLDNAEVALNEAAELNNVPPKIIIRYKPAVLILIDGEPKLEEIENSTLERVVNTPYVILKYKSTYYLASDTMWFEAWSIKGPWTEARSLPKDVQQVDDQIKKQKQEQGSSAPEDESGDDRVPEMVISTEPAELIFIDGKPEFTPLQTSEIMVVSNTDSDVVFEIASQSYYVLLSGRWYRTKDLDNGPWTWVANDGLPSEFSDIPAESDVGYLRTSVAGTEEAREALLEQSVPQTAAVKTSAGASFTVEYDGNRPAHYGNTNINNNIYARSGNSDRAAQTRDRAGTGTRQQPAVARDRANNVYTDKSGNVYRRNENGSWDRRDKGGWSKTDTPSAGNRPSTATQPSTRPSTGTQPSTRPSTGTQPSTRPSSGYTPSTSSLNRDYSARQRGNTRSQQGRSMSSRPSGGSRGGGARRR